MKKGLPEGEKQIYHCLRAGPLDARQDFAAGNSMKNCAPAPA